MFFVCIALFVGGIYLFSLAFHVEGFQGFVFFAGIAAVALALALPMLTNDATPRRE